MFMNFKTVLAAAAIAAMPVYASAASVDLIPNATNQIELGNDYEYQETVRTGAGSTVFDLSATPPSALALAAKFVTLEFTGMFQGLQVFLTNNMGQVNATKVIDSDIVRSFSLDTIFNDENGFDQTLTVAWSGVTVESGTDGVAQFNIQAVPSQVPVPAAGFLLLGALGAAAAVRRRRKPVA